MAILTVLQSKKFVNAEEIAEKFEISLRTVYRDIKALGEIGIPIGYELQKGYFVVQGYFLPPVSFTNEEANAIVLMQVLVERFADKSIKINYETALSKIKAVLRNSDKEKVDYFQSQIKVYKYPPRETESSYLSKIQSAIVERKILEIQYTSFEQKETVRQIEPIGLTFYSLDWHMVAWCWLRNDYRDFKTSRITDLKNIEEDFRKDNHLDINSYIKTLI